MEHEHETSAPPGSAAGCWREGPNYLEIGLCCHFKYTKAGRPAYNPTGPRHPMDWFISKVINVSDQIVACYYVKIISALLPNRIPVHPPSAVGVAEPAAVLNDAGHIYQHLIHDHFSH